jgi:hypothetical protein
MPRNMSIDIPFAEFQYGTPVEFFHYPSRCTYALVRVRDCDESTYRDLMHALVDKFNKAGIACTSDNKITFGLRYRDTMIYIGFYDWTLSIGLGGEQMK